MQMMTDGGGAPTDLKAPLQAAVTRAQTAVQTAFDLDLAERDDAEAEVKASGLCPNVEETMAQFDARGSELRGQIQQAKVDLANAARPYVETGDKAKVLYGHGDRWRAKAEPFAPMAQTMQTMFRGRGRWTGLAGSSYWDKLPDQWETMDSLKEATKETGSQVDMVAYQHFCISLMALEEIVQLATRVQATNGLQGGNRVYFKRSPQAIAAVSQFVGGSGARHVKILGSSMGAALDMMSKARGMVPGGYPQITGTGTRGGTGLEG